MAQPSNTAVDPPRTRYATEEVLHEAPAFFGRGFSSLEGNTASRRGSMQPPPPGMALPVLEEPLDGANRRPSTAV